MKYQNVTLSLPKDVLLKFKHLAIERNKSLSGLMTETIEAIVNKNDEYQMAADENIMIMEEGFDLGTKGRINLNRSDLHER